MVSKFTASLLAVWGALAFVLVGGAPAQAQTSQTGLVTFDLQADRYIDTMRLSQLLDRTIPPETKRLLIFTQCFSGEFAASPFFNKPNTAVAASSRFGGGQEAQYNGYHDDAANALKPEAGRTGQTVHQAGVDGRFRAYAGAEEAPSTGGGMSLADFSLEPTSVTGNVRSRHIIVYVGKPDSKVRRNQVTGDAILNDPRGPRIQDVESRDVIKANFAGQMNTTVRTVGGPPSPTDATVGMGGWDRPGNFDGLFRALNEAGQDIRNSADPSKEQFILYVGDHGDLVNMVRRSNPTAVESNSRSVVATGFRTFGGGVPAPEALLGTPDNVPAFEIFVPFDGLVAPIRRDANGNYVRFHAPGDFVLDVTRAGGPTVVLQNFLEQYTDLDRNDVLGNVPGEGLSFRFAVDEQLFLTEFWDTTVDIAVRNNNPFPVPIGEVTQTTGAVSRGPHIGVDAPGPPIFVLSLNQSVFGEGDPHVLSVFASSADTRTVDIYTLVQVPEGDLFSLLASGQVVPGIAPLVSNVTLPAAFGFPRQPILSATLPALQDGTYLWLGGMVASGTSMLVSNIAQARWTFRSGAPAVPPPGQASDAPSASAGPPCVAEPVPLSSATASTCGKRSR